MSYAKVLFLVAGVTVLGMLGADDKLSSSRIG